MCIYKCVYIYVCVCLYVLDNERTYDVRKVIEMPRWFAWKYTTLYWWNMDI